ncbi:hypothetical protein K1719_038679 [Acacia pycnantha]|nr:hypothetical protein K1719_038679 [Acacia pycnantha]
MEEEYKKLVRLSGPAREKNDSISVATLSFHLPNSASEMNQLVEHSANAQRGPRVQAPLAATSIENGKRILFRFDRAAFSFKFLPFKVPYPVPFKLLGDEAKVSIPHICPTLEISVFQPKTFYQLAKMFHTGVGLKKSISMIRLHK